MHQQNSLQTTQNSELRIITEYKLAMKNFLCIFLELKQYWMYHDQKKKYSGLNYCRNLGKL